MYGPVLLAAFLLQSNVPVAVRVYSDTGARRGDLPVVVPTPDPEPYLRVLTHGYAARLLRLYQLEQRLVRPDRVPQPGILVLSDNQGGFPRFGLYSDDADPGLAYIDLHRRSLPSGRFGAIDQIFPHELLHVIVDDLAGPPPDGNATQVHAIGVGTDRITAFNEGFAEHGQVMAIDDPDTVPETRALGGDQSMRTQALAQFDQYRSALAARIHLAPRAQMTFPLWFSRAEQVLRYHAVRDNLFALEPDVPRALYTRERAYDAYLLENTLPGRVGAQPRSPGRLLSSEGAMAALFYRFVTDNAVQAAYREDTFYGQFGVTRARVDPLDNAYLKLFAAIRLGGYDAAAVLAAYGRLFPDERQAVVAIAARIGLDVTHEAPAELWLLNTSFRTGTSLFDQFRAAPRALAIDLNASSVAELVAVPGVDAARAEEIRHGVPFDSIEELHHVRGMTPELFGTFGQMRAAMLEPGPPGTAAEGRLTFKTVLMPYLWRALSVWMVCAIAGALLYRAVRRIPRWRLIVNGLAAALVVLIVAGTLNSASGLAAPAAPMLLLGLPGAAIRAGRSRRLGEAGRVLAAWALAASPAGLAVTPFG
jgi:hypothetical protein